MAKNPRRKTKGAETQRSGQDDLAGKIIQNTVLFALPGGGLFRAARVGGKIAANVLQRISALGGKRVTTPTAGQLAKAKPLSTLKPLQFANRATSQGGRTAKQAGSSVTKAPGTAVKPKGTSVTSSTRNSRTNGTGVGPAKPPMRNVTPKAKPTTPTPQSRIVGLSNKGKVAAGVAAGLGAAVLLASGKDKNKASAAEVSSPTPRPAKPAKKPSLTYRGGQRKAAPKKGSYDTEKKQNKKGPGVGKQDKLDPRKNFKSTPVKNAALPAGAKPFKGGYDSKTHKLQNIRGKTYVVPKPKAKKK